MPQQPNILFFFPDQWRHDWTELNSKLDLITPNIRRLAERGVVFEDTLVPSPVCAPCRACIATGLNYNHSPVKRNGQVLPLDAMTFYRELRDAGYHTMGCGKFDLHKGHSRWGVDGKNDLDEWGFSDGIDNEGKIDAFLAERAGTPGPYTHHLEQAGWLKTHWEDHHTRGDWPAHATPLPDEHYCDNWLAQNGLDLIDKVPEGKPWFLQVNFTGPHSPWDITESMWESMRGRDFPPPVHAPEHDPEQALEVRRAYSAMVENIDRWVGVYLDRLQERGELDKTLVVFSSDHGEMLFDHGQWGKSTWRHASTNVPMILAGPGVTAGLRRAEPADLIDLPATFLEAAGTSIPEAMDSRSLWPVLRSADADPIRSHVTSALKVGGRDSQCNWRLVVQGQWKFVIDQGKEFLFDREADPEETTNVLDQHPEVANRLRALCPEEVADAAMT